MSQLDRSVAVPFAIASTGIATFAIMDVLMKGLSIQIGAYNAMLWRTLISLFLAGILFYWKKRSWPERSTLRVHIWRGMVTSLMAFLFFWGLAYVPLAEAIGLSFIAPLIALYLAAVLLKEDIDKRAVWASLVGFSGTFVVVAGKLGTDYSDEMGMGIAAILLSAVLYAYNLILQRQQALLAEPIEITFFQNGTVLAIYLVFSPFLAVIPPLELVPHIAAAALFAIVSLLLLSWAYARAQAKVLIQVEYTAFIWAALFGWWVFDEQVTSATLIGTALIVAACLAAARRRPKEVVL